MNANEMKLSEMLIEQAEWWIDIDLGYYMGHPITIDAVTYINDTYPESQKGTGTAEDNRMILSFLCLFEAEFQKDVESQIEPMKELVDDLNSLID